MDISFWGHSSTTAEGFLKYLFDNLILDCLVIFKTEDLIYWFEVWANGSGQEVSRLESFTNIIR